MKNDMTAFDVLAVVKEITPLVGGYLDKVFHWDSRNLLLRVNVPNLGRREIVLLDLKWLYVSSERPETPEFPSQFAVHLRKLLSNARVEGVSQQEFDRVVVIDLQKEKAYKLVIELFGEGNLLLVSEGKIVTCLISKIWKSREVRIGADYQFPPARFNPRTQGFEEFKKTFLSSNSDVVRTLATSINLGGQYAEEVCSRASVEKGTKANKSDEAAVERLYAGLRSILDELPTAQATAVLEGENAVDVTPLPLHIHQDLGRQQFPDFSTALQFFLEHRKVAEKVALGNPEVQKLERQLQQQRDTASRGGEESERLTRAAEALYTAYTEYASMLSTIKKNADKTDWEELRRFASTLPMVESIDPQKKKARVRLADVVADLDYTTSLDDNANLLYSKAKEAREKQSRSLELVHETEARIAVLRAKETKAALVEKTTVKKTKEFWFEAYKWFITSGGHLIVAGRDVRTNDQVVKKHLKLPDRYAHADVHGAPSVVIKDGSDGQRAGAARGLHLRPDPFEGLERRRPGRERLLGAARPGVQDPGCGGVRPQRRVHHQGQAQLRASHLTGAGDRRDRARGSEEDHVRASDRHGGAVEALPADSPGRHGQKQALLRPCQGAGRPGGRGVAHPSARGREDSGEPRSGPRSTIK